MLENVTNVLSGENKIHLPSESKGYSLMGDNNVDK